MKRYTIARATDDVPLGGDVAGTQWELATEAAIDICPWNDAESEEPTAVRSLYDEEALYLQYHVTDRAIFAGADSLNGPVWEDSCVEFFASPDPERRPHYVNFEANCVGTFLLGFGPHRDERKRITHDEAESVRVRTSVGGPTKVTSSDDESWWLAAAIPFEALSTFTGVSLQPRSGTVWRGNFFRLGGRSQRLFATWNPVDAPEPDFHRPTDFGRVVFE